MHFVAATNENSVVPDYLAGGAFRPRSSVRTVSSAMDVGDPSNFRRILHMFGGTGGPGAASDGPALGDLVSGCAWSDEATRACIRDLWERRGIAVDPHTAVGLLGLRRELERRPRAQGVVLATAHPAKFAETVEPLIGESLPVPSGMARTMHRHRPDHSVEIAPKLEALRAALAGVRPPRCP